ncbi:dihydrolipoamide branched chain transacylase, E2 subunit, putative [Eimeria brunetti]|uniref:Dihydrolipoamide acetyltransferase component of pyruvate dehydrogenase complex n=1 Tax=Eimeria brunetti TaxID=51314 RepID=U6LBU2_9EIME|nr:dihydrolipoamide branched chain transacylase, E2 subunit, putative [Eimeria brunetti]
MEEMEEVCKMEEVCEVQSDKAAVEITSRYSGKIIKLYAKQQQQQQQQQQQEQQQQQQEQQQQPQQQQQQQQETAAASSKSMTESLKVPHMNIGDEYDVTRLIQFRRELNAGLPLPNLRLSLTSFFLKAISLALSQYPILNSKFNTNTLNSYTQFRSHNISVAIDSPGGLVVPCVRNVQTLTLVELQQELTRLQELELISTRCCLMAKP